MNKSDTIREWAISKVGCPYIFAANGQKCTPAYREKQMQSKSAYAANIKKYCPVLSGKQSSCDGCKYQDKPAYDCSGLTKEAAKLIGLVLPHGASSQWKGDYWDEKGTIDQMPRDKVCFVFNAMDSADPMGHVGIYLGDGYVVDSRGHAYGTMHTKLESYAWSHYGILRGMKSEEVSGMPETPAAPDVDNGHPTLKKGAKSEYVRAMQNFLIDHGMQLSRYGADGEFGLETDFALRTFQGEQGLEADGICGPATWAALLAAPSPPAATVTYTFTIPMTATQAMAECDRLRAAYGACEMAVG